MIYEFKNFYDEPFEIIKKAKDLDYHGQTVDDVLYKGFSEEQETDFRLKILKKLLPTKEFKNVRVTFRKGTERTLLIHSDAKISNHVAIVYLSIGNNTAFWQNKYTEYSIHTGDKYIEYIHHLEGQDPTRWNLLGLTDGEFNSITIFPADFYHSIFPFEDKNDRLVEAWFFDMSEKEEKKDSETQKADSASEHKT